MTHDPATSPRSIDRRTALGALAGAGALGFASSALGAHGAVSAHTGFLTAEELGYDAQSKTYTLPDLPYTYDALEPTIDEQTMRIHHGKHHAGYVRGLNRALDALSWKNGAFDASLVKHWSRELSFHGSGHANHALFWRTMAPADNGGGGEPTGALMQAIVRDFGNFARFKVFFSAAAARVEGSGWGWLAYELASGRLLVLQGEKQQNMLTTGVVPLLGVDVWEHAYYLNYQNRRAEYIDAWWDVVNWSFVGTLFKRVAPDATD